MIAVRPISERIADEIYDRLQVLTVGHSDATFVSEVIRPTRMGGFTPKQFQIVLTQASPERVPELDYPGSPPANCYSIRFNIRCHVMPSEKDPTPVDVFINTMASDVVRVICEPTLWHTFDNLAIDAQWETHENIDSDGSFDGVNVPLTVFYRTDEGNTYRVRG